MTNTLDEWKAAATANLKTYEDSSYVDFEKLYQERILALISLIEKKDNLLVRIMEKEISVYATSSGNSVSHDLAYIAMTLTEELE